MLKFIHLLADLAVAIFRVNLYWLSDFGGLTQSRQYAVSVAVTVYGVVLHVAPHALRLLLVYCASPSEF
jgi:hypothetical protein